jgi:hypothetical protein
MFKKLLLILSTVAITMSTVSAQDITFLIDKSYETKIDFLKKKMEEYPDPKYNKAIRQYNQFKLTQGIDDIISTYESLSLAQQSNLYFSKREMVKYNKMKKIKKIYECRRRLYDFKGWYRLSNHLLSKDNNFIDPAPEYLNPMILTPKDLPTQIKYNLNGIERWCGEIPDYIEKASVEVLEKLEKRINRDKNNIQITVNEPKVSL